MLDRPESLELSGRGLRFEGEFLFWEVIYQIQDYRRCHIVKYL